MGIKIQWFDEIAKDIILVTYDSLWTWDDYTEAKQSIDDLLLNSEKGIFVINDHTNAPLIPVGSRSSMSEISGAFASAPPNLAGVYTVGAPTIIRIILTSLQRITLNRLLQDLTMTRTLEDALILIRRKQADSASAN